MENQAAYLKIGIFVFATFFASLFFIIWLSGFSHKQEFDYYQIYTKESVSGLGIKAPVRFLGVEVGSIEDISIQTTQGIQVRILIRVKRSTPITEDTNAILQLQGITGLKFIELIGGNENSKLLKKSDKDIPTIKVKESLLSAIDRQSDKLFDLLDMTNEKARIILSDENLKNIALILKNLAQATQKIAIMADSVTKTSNNFGNLTDKGLNMVRGYDEVKDKLNTNLDLLENILLQTNTLIKNLQQSPSDILFKASKNKPAPGE